MFQISPLIQQSWLSSVNTLKIKACQHHKIAHVSSGVRPAAIPAWRGGGEGGASHKRRANQKL